MTEEQNTMLIETHTMTTQVHSAVFGNGSPGLKARVERAEGAFAAVKVIVIAGFSVLGLVVTAMGIIIAHG